MSHYLEESGYNVIQATGAKEALEKAQLQNPDVIVTDVVMPGMSGFELCRSLKRNPATQKVPIVICSSKNQEIDRLWAMRQGADAYVTKPYTRDQHTQEAVVVPVETISSMPNMPGCILGLMNWRSRIIWAVDLPKMLNLEYLDSRQRQYNVIIIRVDSVLLGLVVQEIQGTTKFMPEDIRSPVGQVASSLVPYLRGCVVQRKEILLVLDAQAIVQSSILRSD
jgi:twitching motility protein PilI